MSRKLNNKTVTKQNSFSFPPSLPLFLLLSSSPSPLPTHLYLSLHPLAPAATHIILTWPNSIQVKFSPPIYTWEGEDSRRKPCILADQFHSRFMSANLGGGSLVSRRIPALVPLKNDSHASWVGFALLIFSVFPK